MNNCFKAAPTWAKFPIQMASIFTASVATLFSFCAAVHAKDPKSLAVQKPNALYGYDIGDLNGGIKACDVVDINDSGQIVGNSYIGYPSYTMRAIITGPRGQGLRDLQFNYAGDVAESWALAINNAGVVAGAVRGRGVTALLTHANGSDPFEIAVPPDAVHTTLADLNNLGYAVGSYLDSTGRSHPFISTQSGQAYQALPETGDGYPTTPTSINDSNQIVGIQGLSFSEKKTYVLNSLDSIPLSIGVMGRELDRSGVKVNNSGRIVHRLENIWRKDLLKYLEAYELTDSVGGNRTAVPNRREKLATPIINDYSDDGLMVGAISSWELFPKRWPHMRAWAIDEAGNDWDINQMWVNKSKGVELSDVKAVNKHHQMAVLAHRPGGGGTFETRCYIVCPTENCVVPGQLEREAQPAGKR